MNPFMYAVSAQRYALNRPYFHPTAIAHIKAALNLSAPVACALDVACGTGHSTRALQAIAQSIAAVDLSPQMMAQAPRDPSITYVESVAEQLPFRDGVFDLATLGLAFHWLKREMFLAEAHRVLKPGGWLMIYNNGFANQMRENPAYEQWMKDNYHVRFPRVPSNWQPLTEADAALHGFQLVRKETYTNDVTFTAEGLARYLMTHSNIIVAIESGREREEDVLAWLVEGMQPLFSGAQGSFLFEGTIDYLQAQ